jgi:Secretion system C-terminal sorting domain/Bacterial Ig domain
MGSYSGDGGPATAARFRSVHCLTLHCKNIFVTDAGNYRIRMINYNNTPSFTGGISQTLSVCENAPATSINSLLAVADADTGQTETWSLVLTPSHGSAIVSYSAISTGSTLTPAGLTYMPTTGYIGSDSFKVQVSDCGNIVGMTTIYVTIVNCALGTAPQPAPREREVLRVYPNPVSDELTIQLDKDVYNSFTISNTIGQILIQQGISTTRTKVDVSMLPGGLYYIALNGESGTVVRKIVKE